LERQNYRNKAENTHGTFNNIRSICGNRRQETSEGFCDTLEKIMDEGNKNHYIMLPGEMHARVEIDEVTNIWVRTKKLH
jgi:hypothetical protein